jgi:hypothetical protein
MTVRAEKTGQALPAIERFIVERGMVGAAPVTPR